MSPSSFICLLIVDITFVLLESLVDGLVRLSNILFITFKAADHVDHIAGLAGSSSVDVYFELAGCGLHGGVLRDVGARHKSVAWLHRLNYSCCFR